MRELDDRRKIQYLLALCGTSPEDGTTYFREKVPKELISTPEHREEGLSAHEKYRETEVALENTSLKLRLSGAFKLD